MSVQCAQITGLINPDELITLDFVKTEKGYTQRSQSRGYNRDYISDENFDDIRDWMKCDFIEYKIHSVEFVDE